jgi:hypothetical protein
MKGRWLCARSNEYDAIRFSGTDAWTMTSLGSEGFAGMTPEGSDAEGSLASEGS